jgi:hypoxia up-regulated 1
VLYCLSCQLFVYSSVFVLNLFVSNLSSHLHINHAVNNFQSKRKTPTCITFYRGERMFGSDSYALMGRKPELTFSNIYRMVGRTPEHPVMREFSQQYFPYEMYANETTGATTFKVADTHYTPEELMALILQHVNDMSQAHGGKVIKDCVITVPSSFTQHEKEAVFTAADIADLKVLTLIEENTAAALHYGLDRTFEEPTNVLYFNMGAGTTQVSIVTYSSYTAKEAGKNKTIGQFEVVGKAWDGSLGGHNFDVRLAELLADRFNEAWHKKASGKGQDLKDFKLPMTKLRLQANKVKEILSANAEFPVKAEQLHADVDLNTKVTRAEFEEACEDLFARITGPIDAALRKANLTLYDIKAVELLGGGVRMPRVKKILDGYFAESQVEIGQHLNGDEAMAMGAAFKAANLSTSFRVRKVGATDITSFGVAVRLNLLPASPDTAAESGGGGLFGNLFGGASKSAAAAAPAPAPAAAENSERNTVDGAEDATTTSSGSSSGSDSGVWSKFTALFPSGSAMPSKTKTVAFQHDRDISCQLEYDDSESLPAGTHSLIASYNITGVAAFAKVGGFD